MELTGVDSINSDCINIGHIRNPLLSMGDSCNVVAAIIGQENMNNLRERKMWARVKPFLSDGNSKNDNKPVREPLSYQS